MQLARVEFMEEQFRVETIEAESKVVHTAAIRTEAEIALPD